MRMKKVGSSWELDEKENLMKRFRGRGQRAVVTRKRKNSRWRVFEEWP